MRRDADHFGDDELELVQISRRLREARRVEGVLTEAGIDYGVEADKYHGTFLLFFPVERVGAFFYVRPADAARTRELLRSKGFVVTEIDVDAPPAGE